MSSHPQHLPKKKCKLVSKVHEALTERDDHRRARGGEKKSQISFRMHSNHFGVYLRLHTTQEEKKKRKKQHHRNRIESLFFISFFFFTLRLLLHSLRIVKQVFPNPARRRWVLRERRLRQWARTRRHEFGLRWKHDLWVFHESPALFWWNFTQFPHTIDERKSQKSHDRERTADLRGRESRTDEIFIEKSPIVWNCLRQLFILTFHS